MTPKEKAKELVDKFRQETDGIAGYNYDSVNVKCALIAVGELWNESEFTDGYYQRSQYWSEVKQEIESL